MKKKNLIAYGVLEQYIKKIEEIFKADELDVEEQELVINNVLSRIAKKKRAVVAQDAMDNVNIGGLLGRAMKMVGTGKKDEDDRQT